MKIEELKNTLEAIVKWNGQIVHEIDGAIEDEQGYIQQTHNLKVKVYEVETDEDVLFFVETKNNGNLSEFEQIKRASGQSTPEAVEAYLREWDDGYIEDFKRENIL